MTMQPKKEIVELTQKREKEKKMEELKNFVLDLYKVMEIEYGGRKFKFQTDIPSSELEKLITLTDESQIETLKFILILLSRDDPPITKEIVEIMPSGMLKGLGVPLMKEVKKSLSVMTSEGEENGNSE